MVRRLILGASWEAQFDIRHDIFRHFTRLDGQYYDNTRVGDLMARLTADLNAVRMLIGVGVMQGLNTSLLLAFTLYRMFSLSGTLTLLTLTVVPFITISFYVLLRIIHRRYQKVQEQFSDIAAMAQENFSGIRVVKGFGIENRELDKFGRLNDEFVKRNLSLTRVDGPLFPLMEFLFGLTISLLLLVGGRLVLGVGSDLTIGEFSSFVFLFEGIQWPLIALGWIGNIVQRGTTSWNRLREILDSKALVTDTELTDYSLTSIKGHIELRNVSVSFDGVRALDDVSLVIEPGESVGLTGRTGSGKTLVARLVARLDDPDAGEVLIDGIDVKRYPVEVLRRFIGLVPQEPYLFSDTIAENIAYGVPEAPVDDLMPRVEAAAELAQLQSMAPPMGRPFVRRPLVGLLELPRGVKNRDLEVALGNNAFGSQIVVQNMERFGDLRAVHRNGGRAGQRAGRDVVDAGAAGERRQGQVAAQALLVERRLHVVSEQERRAQALGRAVADDHGALQRERPRRHTEPARNLRLLPGRAGRGAEVSECLLPHA